MASSSGGGEPEKEDDRLASLPSSLAGLKLVDAPILFLVFTHKVFRAELEQLHNLTLVALEHESHGPEFLLDLCRRFEFLNLVYTHHSAAEDEVVFLALDGQVKNVACTYSLEHKSIDDLFGSIFQCLDVLKKEEEDILKILHELVYCTGTIQIIICQHMMKEEEQIFPLLIQQFSLEEQARLVWQYLCGVPILLLKDFLSWMSSFLSSDEREDILHCIQIVVPEEKLLQEVIISWFDSNKRSIFGAPDSYETGSQRHHRPASLKDILEQYPPKVDLGEKRMPRKAYSIQTTGRNTPIDCIYIWHSAIRKDFKGLLEELCQMRSSKSFSTLSSVVIHLNFFIDVLIFYSNILDLIFYPLLNELSGNWQSPFYKKLMGESQMEGLKRILYHDLQGGNQVSSSVELLCGELELFIKGVSRNLSFLESEVLSVINETCGHELQLWLLYASLHMMPFGLLKCSVTWFSSHLSEAESKCILDSIKLGCPTTNNSFGSLLCEWISIGYSGKTSIEKFRKDLREIFHIRNYYTTRPTRKCSGVSFLHLDMQLSGGSDNVLHEPSSAVKAKNSISNPLSSASITTARHDTSYSNKINLQIFLPLSLEKVSLHPKYPAEHVGDSTISNLESRPMDHILLFHKALKKDLEHLVILSAELIENAGLLPEFKRCFHLVQMLYQIHSNTEDEIAFPALESKGKLQNISHSYTIDHKFEVELFFRIVVILNEISKFHGKESQRVQDQATPSYHQLCLKLCDFCISMNRMISDHIDREEIELWPLFRENFSIEEQEKIVGDMLGRTKGEILQELIPWLMASLTTDEQQSMMSLWLEVTKNTKFHEWLGEWWEGMNRFEIEKVEEGTKSSPFDTDPLVVLSTYLFKGGAKSLEDWFDKGARLPEKEAHDYNFVRSGTGILEVEQAPGGGKFGNQSEVVVEYSGEIEKKGCNKVSDASGQADKVAHSVEACQKLRLQDHPLLLNQEELEAVILRVSRDPDLDSPKKSYIIQNLLMSRWILAQKTPQLENAVASDKEVLGQCPSYQDPLKLTFGCKHYKRNSKILAACCNKLYTCIRCHDDTTDHSLNRKTVTQMMCMKCLIIQPIGPKCTTISCNNFSMARYYCKICKLFEDERQIYHCPYCNLCRLGKGLGIDYFHCMKCNACMSRSLTKHVCREKCLEDNCPICHEYIFTSTSPVKALPCGHLMHSACFQDYTCSHYTCPICSKSLGDMQVYFKMLDALLAEEKLPEDYEGHTQVILCNDCEKRGNASFHWLYHKCPHCGSYNTRLL